MWKCHKRPEGAPGEPPQASASLLGWPEKDGKKEEEVERWKWMRYVVATVWHRRYHPEQAPPVWQAAAGGRKEGEGEESSDEDKFFGGSDTEDEGESTDSANA